MAALDSDWLRHFRLLLKNHCMDDHQTFHKCLSLSWRSVVVIWNPRMDSDWLRHFRLLLAITGNPRWKSKMATMDSDWLRHFRLLLKNHCMDDHQTCHKCSTIGPEEVLLLFNCYRKSKMITMDSDWPRHFRLLLKNHCMDNHWTCHKCSFYGPEEVVFLFNSIGNPRWPPWTLIDWDIYNFFSKKCYMDSLKLPQLLLSSFSIHLSYIKMKCYKFRKKRWLATIILTKKSRLGKLWGHIHQRPEKIATLADIYQLSDTGPIGPLLEYLRVLLFKDGILVNLMWKNQFLINQ